MPAHQLHRKKAIHRGLVVVVSKGAANIYYSRCQQPGGDARGVTNIYYSPLQRGQ